MRDGNGKVMKKGKEGLVECGREVTRPWMTANGAILKNGESMKPTGKISRSKYK